MALGQPASQHPSAQGAPSQAAYQPLELARLSQEYGPTPTGNAGLSAEEQRMLDQMSQEYYRAKQQNEAIYQ